MLELNSIFLGKYCIQKVIGKGGMGCVYLAEDRTTHEQYAIKESKLTDKNYELITSEGNILAKLRHPALPAVYQIAEKNSYYYIVMEYMEGKPLNELLQVQNHFPEALVLSWFRQICDILIYLHGLEQPVVYQDMKPSNIIVDNKGNIKIIDFGIAQEYRNPEQADQNVLALTKGYAAPEQYDTRYKSDVRTDIYALGVTIHYLLTGKNPNKPPYHFVPVRKLNSEISIAMEDIVKKCLQPRPDKRYADAEQLKYDLLHIEEIEKRLAGKRRKKIFSGVLTGIAILCILTAVSFKVKEIREKSIQEYYLLIEQAEKNMEMQNYQQAYNSLQQAIEEQPEAEEAYLIMLSLYMQQEDDERCFAYAKDEILVRFPQIYSNAEFLGLMGELYNRNHQVEDSLFYYEQRYALDKENMDYLYDLVMCQISLEHWEDAEKSIEKMKDLGAEEIIINELEAYMQKKEEKQK